MIFLTEYKKDGKTFGSRVEAETWQEAELIVKQTGHEGEEVIGTLEAEYNINLN